MPAGPRSVYSEGEPKTRKTALAGSSSQRGRPLVQCCALIASNKAPIWRNSVSFYKETKQTAVSISDIRTNRGPYVTNEVFSVHLPCGIPCVERVLVGVRIALSQSFRFTSSSPERVGSHRDWDIDHKRGGRLTDVRIEEDRLKGCEGSREHRRGGKGIF